MSIPTYNLIKVADVKNDCYILDYGGLRAVLAIPGVNLNLLSEKEQEIIISQFKSLLDGLDFPIQIFILSRLENINDYLKILHLRLENETDPLIKFQLEEYISFLEDYLESHKIMKKLFFVVVPYDPPEINVGLLKKKESEESFQNKLEALETRVTYITQVLSEMGLPPLRLTDKELIELLFEVYNPSLRWGLIPQPIIEKLSELL